MSSHDHDLPFLTHVHQVLDEAPRTHVTGRDTADAIGIDHNAAESVLNRLTRDGLLEIMRGARRRIGSISIDMPLHITQAGARAANEQRL